MGIMTLEQVNSYFDKKIEEVEKLRAQSIDMFSFLSGKTAGEQIKWNGIDCILTTTDYRYAYFIIRPMYSEDNIGSGCGESIKVEWPYSE